MNDLQNNQALDFAQHDQTRYIFSIEISISAISWKNVDFSSFTQEKKSFHKIQILCFNALRLSYLTLQGKRVEELAHFIVQLWLWKMSPSKLAVFFCAKSKWSA